MLPAWNRFCFICVISVINCWNIMAISRIYVYLCTSQLKMGLDETLIYHRRLASVSNVYIPRYYIEFRSISRSYDDDCEYYYSTVVERFWTTWFYLRSTFQLVFYYMNAVFRKFLSLLRNAFISQMNFYLHKSLLAVILVGNINNILNLVD